MTMYCVLFLFLLFCFAGIAEGKTIKLSDFATANDGEDDSTGFQLAIKRLKESGGGVLHVDEGTWDLRKPIDIVFNGRYTSIIIKGDHDAVITVRLRENELLFYAGNLTRFELRNLIFVGEADRTYDAGKIASLHYIGQSIISGCQFSGLRTKESMIDFKHTSALVENSLFGGLATDGGMAVIEAFNYYVLDVKNSQFIDYAHFLDGYWSKTPWNSGAWIKAHYLEDEPPVNVLGQGIVRVEDSHFDEGGPYAIDLKNISHFSGSGLVFNVQGSDNGTGIRFNNVKYGEVKMSKFGLSVNPRPALTILNNSRIKSTALQFGNRVYFAEVDGSSTALIEECRACESGGPEIPHIPLAAVPTSAPKKNK